MLFCGSGSTGAIAKLIGVLGLRIPSVLDDRYHLSRPHPGRRAPGRVHRPVRAPLQRAAVARVDRRRRHHRRGRRRPRRPRPPRSRARAPPRSPAADRVVLGGIERDRASSTDTAAVSALLHRYGALALWDYAAAAPYVQIDMGSPADGDGYLDAIFVSPHKLIGGPGHARPARRPPDLFTQPGARRARRRHGRLRQPDRARLPDRCRAPGGGRHARHRRLDPGRSRLPVEGGGRRRRDHRAASISFVRRAIERWETHPEPDDPRAATTPNGCRSSRSWCATATGPAATCTTTSS